MGKLLVHRRKVSNAGGVDRGICWSKTATGYSVKKREERKSQKGEWKEEARRINRDKAKRAQLRRFKSEYSCNGNFTGDRRRLGGGVEKGGVGGRGEAGVRNCYTLRTIGGTKIEGWGAAG